MADTRMPGGANVETTVLGADEIILNMGPQHPSTHGVLRVKLRLDGEKVVGSECVIGYLHRGVEKIAEHRSYQQFAPYVDRMDYVAAVSNGLGYCEAVEKLMGVEAPPRARGDPHDPHRDCSGSPATCFGWARTRWTSARLTPLFYCLREREEILKIFEKYCGARLTTHAFRIGGLQYEAYDEFEKEVERFCKDPSTSAIDEYESLLTDNRIWIGPHQGHRRYQRRGRHRHGRHRTGAASQRREMGHAQGHAVRGLRPVRVRHSHGEERRYLRPLPGAHGGDAAIAAASACRRSRIFRRGRLWGRSARC